MSALDGVTPNLSALTGAQILQTLAAATGFEWQNIESIFDKLDEEINEVKEALVHQPRSEAHIAEELGDLLFVTTVLCRKLGLDAETVLRQANVKFTRRFQKMEQLAREENNGFSTLSIELKRELWQRAKKEVYSE